MIDILDSRCGIDRLARVLMTMMLKRFSNDIFRSDKTCNREGEFPNQKSILF